MALSGEKPRIRYVDYFKAIAMLLVILGHINFANQSIKAWIYAFHMPAFFFASGMLLRDRPVPNLRTSAAFLWKRLLSLMIPYFLWALIYTSLEGRNLLRILYGSHQTLGSAGTLTSLWFLPVLLEATALFVAARLVFRKKLNLPIKLLLAAVSFAVGALLPTLRHGYPWCVNIAFPAFGFLLLGNMLFPPVQRFRKRVLETKTGVLICVFALSLAFAGSLLYRVNVPEKGYINMANALYGNFALFFLSACMGTAFILFLSILLERIIPARKSGKADILTWLGQNTLCAFAVQKPIIKVFRRGFEIVRVPTAVSLCITCIGTAVACCLIALFLNRYLPSVIGRIPEKKRT